MQKKPVLRTPGKNGVLSWNLQRQDKEGYAIAYAPRQQGAHTGRKRRQQVMNHGGMSVQVNGQRPVGRVFLAHVIGLVLRPPLDVWARVWAKTMYCWRLELLQSGIHCHLCRGLSMQRLQCNGPLDRAQHMRVMKGICT